MTFHPWQNDVPAEMEICAIALPGRESRLRESPCRRLRELAEVLADRISPHLDRDFAFFGHSIGSWVCFELARSLRRRGLPIPRFLFVASNYAPHLPIPHIPYEGSDSELIDALQELFNGFPRELLNDPDYLQIFLPAVRADIEMLMTYTFQDEAPLDCGITAFGGTDDPWVSQDAMQAWKVHTRSGFRLHMIPGDHFGIHGARRRILDTINRELCGCT